MRSKYVTINLLSGVELTTGHSRTYAPGPTFKADAALITLPLGVLKESLRGSGVNSVQFSPPLPSWKTEAISRMGFGNLNKVLVRNKYKTDKKLFLTLYIPTKKSNISMF